MWFIIGIIIILSLFNPWTGLFGNTLYSPKQSNKSIKTEPKHRSFRLTKEN